MEKHVEKEKGKWDEMREWSEEQAVEAKEEKRKGK